MKAAQILIIFLLTYPGYLLAEENPACSHPGSSTYVEYTPSKLRSIAASCNNSDIARLFYNRAYHKDLLAEGNVLSGLDTLNEQSGYQVTAYRLYIALIEDLAPLYYPDIGSRVSFLNKIYERRGEVFELRIRGYDQLADALERKSML